MYTSTKLNLNATYRRSKYQEATLQCPLQSADRDPFLSFGLKVRDVGGKAQQRGVAAASQGTGSLEVRDRYWFR